MQLWFIRAVQKTVFAILQNAKVGSAEHYSILYETSGENETSTYLKNCFIWDTCLQLLNIAKIAIYILNVYNVYK